MVVAAVVEAQAVVALAVYLEEVVEVSSVVAPAVEAATAEAHHLEVDLALVIFSVIYLVDHHQVEAATVEVPAVDHHQVEVLVVLAASLEAVEVSLEEVPTPTLVHQLEPELQHSVAHHLQVVPAVTHVALNIIHLTSNVMQAGDLR